MTDRDPTRMYGRRPLVEARRPPALRVTWPTPAA